MLKLFSRGRGGTDAVTPNPRDAAFATETGQHRLQFTPGGDTLIVAFDHASRPVNEPYEGRDTWGASFYRDQGHALLGVIAMRTDWYRDAALIAALERLRDEGFFASFRNVVMTGGSMGGFAAMAFAPLAPGCTVIAFSPQTTLAPDLVPWDTRFPEGLKQDWSLPYSDAATGVSAAGRTYVVYDPLLVTDRRHVERLPRSATLLRMCLPGCGHGGTPALSQMGVLKAVTMAMIDTTMRPPEFRRIARLRRQTAIYAQTMAGHALDRGHPAMALRICALSTWVLPLADLRQIRGRALGAMGVPPDQQAESTLWRPAPQVMARTLSFAANYPCLRRNIIVVSYPGAGSERLQAPLSRIPGCVIRGENNNMMRSVWTAATRGGSTRNEWGQQGRGADDPWFGADVIRPAMFAQGLIDSFVAHILSPPVDARYFGFRESRFDAFGDNLHKVLDFMRAHFHDPLFILATRDADAVAAMAPRDEDRPKWHEMANSMDARFRAYAESRPQAAILLRFEDYEQNAQALTPVFDRLAEPFDHDRLSRALRQAPPSGPTAPV